MKLSARVPTRYWETIQAALSCQHSRHGHLASRNSDQRNKPIRPWISQVKD